MCLPSQGVRHKNQKYHINNISLEACSFNGERGYNRQVFSGLDSGIWDSCLSPG